MKTTLLFLSVFLSVSLFGQYNFKWDFKDSIDKSKSQIYSDTKMFIAEKWKSAQNVIQNDDKEGGAILVKGISIQTITKYGPPVKYTYSYTVRFLMKESRFRVSLENVTNISAICAVTEWELIPASDDGYPGKRAVTLNQVQYERLMSGLKQELHGIIDEYLAYIHEPSIIDDW